MSEHAVKYVSIRSRQYGRGRRMNFKDIFVILSLSLADSFKNISPDLVQVTKVLLRHSFISRAMCDLILQKYLTFTGDSSERCRQYYQHISRYITFKEFILALRTAWCFRFADALLLELFGEPGLCMATSEIPNAGMMNRFYNSMKSLLNSGMFPNKIAALENISIYLRKLAVTGRNHDGRQCAFDKLALVTCLKVNCYIDKATKLAILSKLLNDVPEGLAKHSAEMIYCIAMCMTSRKCGDNDKAGYHLDEAKGLNTIYTNTFFKFLIWHTQHIMYRTMYSREPTSENLKLSTKACQFGMDCAIPETEVIRQPWTTTFKVFSALLLLRIGQAFQILPGTEPNEDDRNAAEEIINAAKRESKSWDSRREMMYQLCMARIHEGTERNLAIEECRSARLLAKEGAYTVNERRNLKAYYTICSSAN